MGRGSPGGGFAKANRRTRLPVTSMEQRITRTGHHGDRHHAKTGTRRMLPDDFEEALPSDKRFERTGMSAPVDVPLVHPTKRERRQTFMTMSR